MLCRLSWRGVRSRLSASEFLDVVTALGLRREGVEFFLGEDATAACSVRRVHVSSLQLGPDGRIEPSTLSPTSDLNRRQPPYHGGALTWLS